MAVGSSLLAWESLWRFSENVVRLRQVQYEWAFNDISRRAQAMGIERRGVLRCVGLQPAATAERFFEKSVARSSTLNKRTHLSTRSYSNERRRRVYEI